MDMIDKYLGAIAAQLPQAERADIIAELRDLILNRFEAKERELGRALNDAERESILREIGHPLVVAARYRKGPDSLVGPELFPYWLFAVKAGLIVIAAFCMVGFLIDLASGASNTGRAIAQGFHSFYMTGLMLIGGLTLAGAIFEHYQIRPRFLTHWRVSDLSAFGFADPSRWGMDFLSRTDFGSSKNSPPPAPVAAPRRARWPGMEHVVPLLVNIIFLLWWIGVVHIPGLSRVRLSGEDAVITGAPIWDQLFGAILLYVLLQIAVHVVGLLQPYAVRLRAGLQIGAAFFGIWLGWTILNAGHWFTLTRSGESARVEGGLYLLNSNAFHDLNSWREFTSMASNMGTIWSWVLVAIIVSLMGKVVTGFWKLAHS